MPATYPLAIKTFQVHKDLTDIVFAANVNDLQDEVDALEETLGINPHQDTTLINTVNTWSTVGDRINYITRGKDKPVWDLYRHDPQTITTSATDAPLNKAYTAIQFPQPVTDTHNLFNGTTGIKVKRPGYYHVNAGTFFDGSAIKGVRRLAIFKNSSRVAGDGVPWAGGTATYSNTDNDCSWTGVLTPSDTLWVGIWMDTWGVANAGKFNVTDTHFHGFFIRDL